MSEPVHLSKEEVRRQYIAGLIPERFSAEKSRNGDDVTTEEMGDNSYHILAKLIHRGITYFEERLNDYCDDLAGIDRDDDKSVLTLMNDLTYLEDFLMQTYRNKRREHRNEFNETLEGHDSSDTSNPYLHQEVLAKIHPEFLQDVNIDGTYIMDRMVQDQLMTDDERESIVGEKTSRRRKEAFLMLMRGRLSYQTLFNNFIPALELDHPDIAKKLKAAAVEVKEETRTPLLCAVCNMKQTVDVKHLAEHLFAKRVISADLYEELRRSLGSVASKWSGLLSSVSNPSFIVEAIQTKFPVIYEALKKEHATDLECRCGAVNKPDLRLEDLSVSNVSKDVANLDDLRSLIDPSEFSGSLTNAENAFINGNIMMLEQKFSSGQSHYLQVNRVIGNEGGVLSLSTVSETQVVLPKGALVKAIVVGLQVQMIAPELVAKHLGSPDAASAIVTIDPRRRKLHKPAAIAIQRPKGAFRSQKNIALMCSIAAKGDDDRWEDITGSTPLKYDSGSVSLTSTVSARFWLIDCPKSKRQEIVNALYKESMITVS